jgi:sodium-dependent dicarboxylate transporter 2/3/5
MAAVSLFLISADNKKILDWKEAAKIPWGVLLLIGGGLALAQGFILTDLDDWFVSGIKLFAELPLFAMILAIVTIVIFLEFLSNTATSAFMIPIAASMALLLQVNPILLMVAVTMATSPGYMLVSSTPPNAIAVSTGHVSTRMLAKVGLPLNLLSAVIIAILTVLIVPLIW